MATTVIQEKEKKMGHNTSNNISCLVRHKRCEKQLMTAGLSTICQEVVSIFLEKLSLDWQAYIKGLPSELHCQASLAIGTMWG